MHLKLSAVTAHIHAAFVRAETTLSDDAKQVIRDIAQGIANLEEKAEDVGSLWSLWLAHGGTLEDAKTLVVNMQAAEDEKSAAAATADAQAAATKATADAETAAAAQAAADAAAAGDAQRAADAAAKEQADADAAQAARDKQAAADAAQQVEAAAMAQREADSKADAAAAAGKEAPSDDATA